MLHWQKLIMDSANDDGSPSGYGAETETTATTTETTQTSGDTSDGAKGNTSTEGTTVTPAATDDKSKQTSTTEDVTGYTNKEGDKGDTKETVVTDDKPLELDLKGLEEDKVKHVRDFAKEHNLTKEQAQGMIEKIVAAEAQVAKNKETIKAQEVEVYKTWESELKSDPDFGGENYAHSVHNVNKLLNEDMVGIKKLLTGSGKRLPPSVMKDLNNVARKLYGETELVQGEKGSSKETWNPLDFYNKK